MRLLVDTHIALWRITDNPRLPARAVELMDRSDTSVEVSVVSIWEVAVKHALGRTGRDAMPLSGTAFLWELREVGLSPLPIRAEHAAAVDDLPPLHGDPFDRFLIATARHEGMTLLTHDAKLAQYGDHVLVV